MQTAKKGDWVQIHQIVLKAGERAPQVPEDTQAVPLELWVKGILQQDAAIGDSVIITTVTGRTVTGELTAVNPGYTHNYGSYVPELLKIDTQLKDILYGGSK
ncbi:MAG: 2-amino-4-oxopentanoate thiolase subunit OrtA [Bacteroidota bacterium]|nr:2-amino-4-oxopentanoate thiolase subunit OrtA [Bacteroidota bacterium]